MKTLTAEVISIRTDGHHANRVTVACPFCRGQHTYEWFDDDRDGLRSPTCGASATFRIAINTRARVDAMRTEYPTPDGVVSLIPLNLSYCFERDGNDDIIGVVTNTTIGAFVLWLAAGDAMQLVGQLVDILENREVLREKYAQRELTSPNHPG